MMIQNNNINHHNPSRTHTITCITMKLVTFATLLTTLSAVGAASLRGKETEIFHGSPFAQFKCMLEAFSNEEKCAESVNDDGEPCSYCTIKDDDGNEAGLCVDPSVAPNMEQMNPQVSCTNDASSDGFTSSHELEDYHDYKCSIKGFTDPEKCSHMHTDDGMHHCQYCTMNGPFGEQGICVSPKHAKDMKKVSPMIECSKDGTIEKKPVPMSSPVTDCNLSGKDVETCLDPSKVNGSECIWCDAKIGGFCFPKTWSDTASRYLTCTDHIDEMLAEQ